MKREELVASRWSLEKAKAYMEPFGVIKGVNFIPSYCYSYIEMWHHFLAFITLWHTGMIILPACSMHGISATSLYSWYCEKFSWLLSRPLRQAVQAADMPFCMLSA